MQKVAMMLVVFIMLLVPAAWAAAPSQSSLSVRDGWVRAVPPVSRATAAYMMIVNQTSQDDTLLYVGSEAAKVVELHTVIAQPDGARAMKQVAHIAIPKGVSTPLVPGGYHVMLIDLVKPLKAGDEVELQLIFQKAGSITVKLPVQATPEDGKTETHHHHHHH